MTKIDFILRLTVGIFLVVFAGFIINYLNSEHKNNLKPTTISVTTLWLDWPNIDSAGTNHVGENWQGKIKLGLKSDGSVVWCLTNIFFMQTNSSGGKHIWSTDNHK